MKLRWLGHSAFEMISNAGLNILVDPFIQANPHAPLRSMKFTRMSSALPTAMRTTSGTSLK